MHSHQSLSSTSEKSTMLLQIGTSWAVCTRTPVPIILARFPQRPDAVRWQQDHEARVRPQAA
ncbi:MAG: hypothetical protein QF471_06645 [Phycisphaerales bacterium]|nr:hypothetical protein [Phycisphaerales bacterium]